DGIDAGIDSGTRDPDAGTHLPIGTLCTQSTLQSVCFNQGDLLTRGIDVDAGVRHVDIAGQFDNVGITLSFDAPFPTLDPVPIRSALTWTLYSCASCAAACIYDSKDGGL